MPLTLILSLYVPLLCVTVPKSSKPLSSALEDLSPDPNPEDANFTVVAWIITLHWEEGTNECLGNGLGQLDGLPGGQSFSSGTAR